MHIQQQTTELSDYFFSQPLDNLHNLFHFNCDYRHCPFYAPVVKDAMCRLCHRYPKEHKKYFIYSNKARKIQKVYFRYLLMKKNKFNPILFNKYNIDYNLLNNILNYKNLRYIRKLNK